MKIQLQNKENLELKKANNKVSGILIRFGKIDSSGCLYEVNNIDGFGSIDKIIIYNSKESAEKQELHNCIGRAKITADDNNLYYEAELFNTVAGLDYKDKIKNKPNQITIYKPLIKNKKLIAIYSETII